MKRHPNVSPKELLSISQPRRINRYGRTLRAPHRLDLEHFFFEIEFHCGETQGGEYVTKSTSTSSETTQLLEFLKTNSELFSTNFAMSGVTAPSHMFILKILYMIL
ncbi:hypothetical protein HNY73_003191 [Argiope bruennichi]|uniref:Uncharacterized protein n=1 Tax=Argiope bruennichi TaxID=94029 RepID=A0A8T0FYQ5_ARGBR|nr:hypothetical protein HNY73_003191 [Argiope bruennichi]